MLRHEGRRRTFFHNLKLASILSTVAGIVNIVGVLSVKVLTTNVTGHFAFFSEELFFKDYSLAGLFLIYIFSFLGGAFISSLLMDFSKRIRFRSTYILPVFLEITLFILVMVCSLFYTGVDQAIASMLLFAMGLQNALVTRVSQSVVRTTHLTGLFTDLGIELSFLFFKQHYKKRSLRRSIGLKISIIGGFFLGCILGGFVYQQLEIYTLFIPVALLLFALWYDRLIFKYLILRRKLIAQRRNILKLR
ncbi:YoaK family protein [Myroides indicus]|uniref:Uncharacterized membrane protein YoaK (UPF0700 family) n=1 Tax=Myroides indicus TaxID=1323422 RepID=A0A4V3E7L9_9FLAO|nr:YoaK family protein [Myroides indicus]TDS52092.1 uncharacterized membrane protein YoaK (UPF0700 family) [Myroides indicus]